MIAPQIEATRLQKNLNGIYDCLKPTKTEGIPGARILAFERPGEN